MSELNDLVSERNSLRLELHTLRFKTSQQERFIWWVWNVYSKNIQELLMELEKTTFPVTPFGMSALVKHIKEGTNGIYDGTYLDVEIYGAANVCSSSREIGHIPDNIARFLAEKSISIRRTNWMPFKTSWAAPAVNQRYLVKLQNDWVCIATYYLRVGGGYWKNDSGQELEDGVVEFWKGLDE